MKCNKCGAELRIVSEEYCKDEQERPMYKEYACCDFCKTKVPLQNNPLNNQATNPMQPNNLNAGSLPPKKKRKWVIGIVIFLFVCYVISTFSDDSSDTPTEVTSETKETDNKKANADTDNKGQSKEQDKTKQSKATKKPAATKKPKPTLSPKQAKAKAKKEAQAAKKKFINSCKEYPYKKVMRNPKKFVNKKIKIKCQISQISQGGFFTKGFLRCYSYSGYGIYAENEYVVYDERVSSSPKLLDDDIITVYGIINEPEEMTRALTGTSEEVFTITMKYVKLHKK